MALTISAYTGSTDIGTAEWSMVTDSAGPDVSTTVGVFQAYIDLSAMTAADQFKLAIYEKAITGGTQRKVEEIVFTGVQAKPNAVTPSLMLGIGWDMTLIKVAGTDRSLPWRIAQVV